MASETAGLAKKLGVSKQWLLKAVAHAKNEPIKSRTGKMGRIVLNQFTGSPEKSYASHCIRKLEENVGGKYDVAEKLQAAGNLNDSEKQLIELIMKRSRTRARLATLVAEAGCDPARIVKLYAEGAVALGKAEALAVASQGLGAIARQLVRQASIGHVSCTACMGAGVVPVRNGLNEISDKTTICLTCRGEKIVEHVDKHYKFAVTKLLDMAALGKEPAAVNVSTNVAVQQNNNNTDTSGFMERLSKLTDGSGGLAVRVAPEVIDVQPEDHTVEAG